MAPGWFHCRRYLWLAQQLAEGQLDHDTLSALNALDENRQDRTPEAKVSLAKEALTRTPNVAWLYLSLGRYLKDLNQDRESESAIRSGLDQPSDPDIKSCLLLELALSHPQTSPERANSLEEVRRLNGNLMATALAGFILKSDKESQP